MRVGTPFLVSAALACGCSPHPPMQVASSPAQSEQRGPVDGESGESSPLESSAPVDGTPSSPEAGTDAPAEQPPEPQAAPPGPALTAAQKQALSLPEVRVKTVGLHIGGQANSPENKRKYLPNIESSFEDFRWCYRLIGDPKAGGTFGVDLEVPVTGGRAVVRQVRTRIKGGEFRDCVVEAFGRIRFGEQERATMVSYSMRFIYEDPHEG